MVDTKDDTRIENVIDDMGGMKFHIDTRYADWNALMSEVRASIQTHMPTAFSSAEKDTSVSCYRCGEKFAEDDVCGLCLKHIGLIEGNAITTPSVEAIAKEIFEEIDTFMELSSPTTIKKILTKHLSHTTGGELKPLDIEAIKTSFRYKIPELVYDKRGFRYEDINNMVEEILKGYGTGGVDRESINPSEKNL